MDNSIGIRPRPGVTPRSRALRDPVTVRETAATELSPAKAVAAATEAGTQHGGDGRRDDSHAREALIDPHSGEALLRAAEGSAAHPEETPNRALMRERAYHQLPREGIWPQDVANQTRSPDRDPHADLKA